MPSIKLTVNGVSRTIEIEEGRVTLLDVLRDRLDLTGSKLGCGVGQCGACTVIMNGEAVASCTTLARNADGAEILTIEGLSVGYTLHPIQEAFIEAGAVQCGFCTPGLIMRTYALLTRNPEAAEEEVREALSRHLCRCTGYESILEAVRLAQRKRTGLKPASL
ncbi:MAG TPA: (2Fe-2S)-binding protein [Spirochaetia bacterium]|nr:(2Fe-2S)-binding protein [Spirochaetia bacterium]